MSFRYLMNITAVIMFMFGLYLLGYGAYNLWEYRDLLIPEAVDKDAHGMSRLVGYTFICMFGVMVLGVGLLTWLSRSIADVEAQQGVTLGLFVINALAFILSLTQQIMYWSSGWGQFYVTTFLLLTLAFGYSRFVKPRPT